tara:strand:+ start:377 stop:724 length:348 start_codon:yes stop_codon:yes gene_type:complete
MFKYLFGNNTTVSVGEKPKQKKKTIGSKQPKDEGFLIINPELPSLLPTFENIEDVEQQVQQEDKFKKFINQTVEKAQQFAIDEWEDSGFVDANVMSEEEFNQQKLLSNIYKQIGN